VNTECRYLLLRRAFEAMDAIRVQLKTHHLNVNSQRAIERLGAVKEGVLRNHMIMPDGSYHHSVYYSIIESECHRLKIGTHILRVKYATSPFSEIVHLLKTNEPLAQVEYKPLLLVQCAEWAFPRITDKHCPDKKQRTFGGSSDDPGGFRQLHFRQ
jgi:hypothetical protein